MAQGASAIYDYDYDYDYDSNTVCFGDCNCPSSPCSVPGCIDPSALNYNPSATIDDGSCTYPPVVISGCMDSSALNYDSSATVDDGSCTYPPVVISGCMDSSALNYDSSATVDDGSCTYPPVVISGCMDSSALNYDSSATVDDGSCTYPPTEKTGCTNPAATNYDPTATIDSGNCQFPGSPSILGGVTNIPEIIPEIIVKGEEAFPELVIEKTVNKDSVDSGTYVFYTIKVTNNGDADAVNLVVEDDLPEGFIDDSNSSKVVWEVPLLEKNGGVWTKTFPIYVSQSVESGSYENIATTRAENYLNEVKDSAIVRVGTLPHTGVNSFTWFIFGGLAIFFIGILGLISIFTKKYRKAIQFVVFSGLIVIALVILSYPFLPAIKYNLSIPVVNSEEIKDIEEAIDVEGDWLIIPSIGVEIPIVLGQDDSALEKGAWLLPCGSTPDSEGNTALAAHRFKYKPPHKETFYLLDKVKSGDSFYVYWQGKKYTYIVTSSNVVEPKAIEVLNQTKKSIVTLITCTPLFSDKNRLVVVGELVI